MNICAKIPRRFVDKILHGFRGNISEKSSCLGVSYTWLVIAHDFSYCHVNFCTTEYWRKKHTHTNLLFLYVALNNLSMAKVI